jgi:hypothetical protein
MRSVFCSCEKRLRGDAPGFKGAIQFFRARIRQKLGIDFAAGMIDPSCTGERNMEINRSSRTAMIVIADIDRSFSGPGNSSRATPVLSIASARL